MRKNIFKGKIFMDPVINEIVDVLIAGLIMGYWLKPFKEIV